MKFAEVPVPTLYVSDSIEQPTFGKPRIGESYRSSLDNTIALQQCSVT
ncbi:hypothetical protein [Aquaspirillum soli]